MTEPSAIPEDRRRKRPVSLTVMSDTAWNEQFTPVLVERLQELTHTIDPMHVTRFDDPRIADLLASVDVLLTGWGAPTVDAAVLRRMPRLHAIFHCAGTIRSVVTPDVWTRGILVSSSAEANAGPVAQYTVAAMVMAGKKAPFLAAAARTRLFDSTRFGPLGNRGLTLGIVGHSRIGRRVIALANEVMPDARILVYDPFADAAVVGATGASLVDLATLLASSHVLSIHAPELPSTRHMIGAVELASLPDHATVINTARGSLIDTEALTAECASGRLNAILDVTDPEPLPASSILYDLPNVVVTPHIAGSQGAETQLMTSAALDEIERFTAWQPMHHRIDEADLQRIA